MPSQERVSFLADEVKVVQEHRGYEIVVLYLGSSRVPFMAFRLTGGSDLTLSNSKFGSRIAIDNILDPQE